MWMWTSPWKTQKAGFHQWGRFLPKDWQESQADMFQFTWSKCPKILCPCSCLIMSHLYGWPLCWFCVFVFVILHTCTISSRETHNWTETHVISSYGCYKNKHKKGFGQNIWLTSATSQHNLQLLKQDVNSRPTYMFCNEGIYIFVNYFWTYLLYLLCWFM